MSVQIGERDGRLYLTFWEPDYSLDSKGNVVQKIISTPTQEIDITAHIERAVENVLRKRDCADGQNPK
jgi:hypothetical protein